MRKRVRVINTGGTLTMVKSPSGYVPASGFLEKVTDRIPSTCREALPEIDYTEWDPLLDSSNIEPHHWSLLAKTITDAYDRYDGFVILHGTDTMAYSASALSFLLPGLSRPVILTGAMRPLDATDSDAPWHWQMALTAAATSDLPEVAIAFDNRLLRGCRSTKINASESTAFETPRYPALASTDPTVTPVTWHTNPQHWLKPGTLCQLNSRLQPHTVCLLWWAPGQSPDTLQTLPERGCRVLILVIFGSGNAPTGNPEFMRTLASLRQAGLHILTLSQCPYGRIEDTAYEAGKRLKDLGIHFGHGITLEAAYTKAMIGASQGWNDPDLDSFLSKNQVGEQC